jgi:hypothetical protein
MSLREAIEAAVNTAEEAQTAPVTPAPVEAPVVQADPIETLEQKAGRTEGRQRDEHGRLLPGKAAKQEPPIEAPKAPVALATPVVPPAPTQPPPSSWKRDHWESWNKIASENPQLAEYLQQREGEFAKGVSTYKQEYEQVKPLQEAMQPFIPQLQQRGIQPAQWIAAVGRADQMLTYGTPQEKLQMFAQLAQNCGVPLQALYEPQAQQQFLMQQTLQPPAPMPDVKALVQEQLNEVLAKQDLQQFEAARDAQGNTLYPHYEQVRTTMAQLLDAGIAKDLKGAYDKAIRMHDDIWAKEQEAKQAAAKNTVQVAQAAQVAKAKAAAVSPRTTTPGVGTPAGAPKGIRSSIEAAVESREAGRV